MLLIKNGKIVDPVTKTEGFFDLLVEDGIISKIGKDLTAEGAEVIEGTGCVIAPGLVDTHVHFRDPGFPAKETMETGVASAKRGGFTTVICMANTKPAVDSVEVLEGNLKKAKDCGIHMLQAVTVTKGMQGKEMNDLKELAAHGAAGFTDDGVPIMDETLLYEAMKLAAECDLPISLHEEDPAFLASPGVNQGKVSEAIGVGGASALAEEVLTARDCAIALHTGADVVIQHISSGKSVELVRNAKKMGAKVHAEATPHHFTLTEDAVLTYGTYARMNPPLRTEEDRLAIIDGLKDNTIDVIATDHAPHTAEEKAQEFAKAPSGITGLETSLSLGVTTLVKGGHLTMMELMERMSKNPAELYRLDPKGIQEGAPADLVIFAPDETWVAGDYASKATNTPFTGWKLYAPVKYTICGGEVVYEGKQGSQEMTYDYAAQFADAPACCGTGTVEEVIAYVDGSFNVSTKEFAYGVVIVKPEGEETFSKKMNDPELASMHNVAGEIKGAEAAMQYALDHGAKRLVIYHDYEGIAKWCLGLWKTNKEGTKAYKAFYEEAKKSLTIEFVKVTGHSGDKYNDLADRLAKNELGIA